MNSTTIYSAEPAKGWLPWGALAPFLCVVFVAAPLLGVSKLLERFHLADAKGDPVDLPGLFAFLVYPFAAIGLVVLAWIHFVERRPLATIGLGGAERLQTFIRGQAIGLATSAGVVAAIWMAGGLVADGYGKAFGAPMTLGNMCFLLVCFMLQGGVEEILFRGWLLSAIARKLDIVAAVVPTSVVFTFLHYSPHQYWLVMLSSFLFSTFTCCWALKTNNIWGVIGWHSGWNWLLAVGFELPVTELDAKLPALIVKLTPVGPVYLTGGAQGPEGSFLCSVFFAVASVFLVWSTLRETDSRSRLIVPGR
ncbi:MAG: type II CAAX endopeptidase family protein [Betaproteobacteria bacterium]